PVSETFTCCPRFSCFKSHTRYFMLYYICFHPYFTRQKLLHQSPFLVHEGGKCFLVALELNSSEVEYFCYRLLFLYGWRDIHFHNFEVLEFATQGVAYQPL